MRLLSRKLNYKSLPNIRDLGGMRTADGRQIISGKLIRSGHLSGMPEEEVSALADLVGAVIDFRSDGIVSGVHWIIAKERERESANAFARDVFPTPGTSSRRRWPPDRRVRMTLSITSPLPTIRCSILRLSFCTFSFIKLIPLN